VHLGIDFRVEHHLGDPLAVAEIDENDPAVVAPALDPAHEHHFTVNVRSGELVAVVGPAHISQFV
jgi:hypothetical protein